MCSLETHRRNGRRIACKSVDARRRPCFRVEFAYPKGSERDERAVAKPNFEVERSEQIYSAQAFAATRFGSTKLKTYQAFLKCHSLPFEPNPPAFFVLPVLVTTLLTRLAQIGHSSL
ncbi:hypothetical protein OESDEN_09424 [Oesophagostomum dentatum]|uniref:Uncharacterized protein n=1 Tax=Oesophagostomum dentatum TaxID=61180 RepID=A0A0B1T3L4_OESDE|nr:hypothetical protein OESDEN_09424 [Oesophagostomum dentatum]